MFSTPTTTVTSLARTRIGCPESSGGGKVKSSKSWGGKKTLERRNVTLFTPTFDCQMRERIASFDSSSSRESRSPRLSVGSETRQARMLKQISVKTDWQQRGTPSFIVFDRKRNRNRNEFLLMQRSSAARKAAAAAGRPKRLARPIVRTNKIKKVFSFSCCSLFGKK